MHEPWETQVIRRVGTGGSLPTGCPSCCTRGSRQWSMPCFCRSLAADPELSRDWSSEGNEGLLPEAVALKSCQKRTWRCLNNRSHPDYQTTPMHRSSLGSGCPECAREARRIKTRHGTLAEEHPDLAAQWDYDANVGTPQDVTSGSNRRVSWICPKSTCQHPHRWDAVIAARTKKGSGCPFCSGRVCCPCNSLGGKHPALLQDWAWAKNAAEGLDPEKLSPFSTKKAWWLNAERGMWQQAPSERVMAVERRRRKVIPL